jgi:hypothetical protein
MEAGIALPPPTVCSAREKRKLSLSHPLHPRISRGIAHPLQTEPIPSHKSPTRTAARAKCGSSRRRSYRKPADSRLLRLSRLSDGISKIPLVQKSVDAIMVVVSATSACCNNACTREILRKTQEKSEYLGGEDICERWYQRLSRIKNMHAPVRERAAVTGVSVAQGRAGGGISSFSISNNWHCQ